MDGAWKTSIDLNTITDEELYLVLQRLGISAGPIVGSTRQFYKNKVKEIIREPDNEDTLNNASSDRFGLHETNVYSCSNTSRASEGYGRDGILGYSSSAMEEALLMSSLEQSRSRESPSELKQRAQPLAMSTPIEEVPSRTQPPPFSSRVRPLSPGKYAGFDKYWGEQIAQRNRELNAIRTKQVKTKQGKMMLLIKIIGTMILLLVMYYVWKESASPNSMLIDSDENPTAEDYENLI